MTTDDSTLIANISRGDYSSFNQLFTRYYGRLCASVFTITHDATVAEDIVQDFYIKLWNKRSALAKMSNVRAYLFTSCHHAALNYLRGEKTRKKHNESFVIDQPTDDEATFKQELYLDELEKCIDQLPARSKQVFLMHKFEEFSQKEISEQLNISVKTIKNQIWRSLQYLRDCLKLSIQD